MKEYTFQDHPCTIFSNYSSTSVIVKFTKDNPLFSWSGERSLRCYDGCEIYIPEGRYYIVAKEKLKEIVSKVDISKISDPYKKELAELINQCRDIIKEI